MWQWRNQGPGLSAMKRIVTGVAPALAVSTSRRIISINQITCSNYNITTRWVDEVAFSTSTLDNVERVAVKVEWVAGETSDVDLNYGPLGVDNICVLCRVKVTCVGRAGQDLEESWKSGRHVCDIVDSQGESGGIDINAK